MRTVNEYCRAVWNWYLGAENHVPDVPDVPPKK